MKESRVIDKLELAGDWTEKSHDSLVIVWYNIAVCVCVCEITEKEDFDVAPQ